MKVRVYLTVRNNINHYSVFIDNLIISGINIDMTSKLVEESSIVNYSFNLLKKR